jgi:hypothetical protein
MKPCSIFRDLHCILAFFVDCPLRSFKLTSYLGESKSFAKNILRRRIPSALQQGFAVTYLRIVDPVAAYLPTPLGLQGPPSPLCGLARGCFEKGRSLLLCSYSYSFVSMVVLKQTLSLVGFCISHHCSEYRGRRRTWRNLFSSKHVDENGNLASSLQWPCLFARIRSVEKSLPASCSMRWLLILAVSAELARSVVV